MNKPLSPQNPPLASSSYPLITRERTQQLDLLQHLVSNIARGIVLCGPEGIGKTKMLTLFQASAPDHWIICAINGDSQLSLEMIHQRLSQTLNHKMPHFKFRSLSHALERLGEQDVRIVLVVDDAGQLMPGLIEEMIAYADGKPALRNLFALTHSELYLKNSTDPAIEDCYQIEMPALSEQQCGEFLEYLSTLPKPRVHYNGINETRIATLFRETHGIPGNILDQLPKADSGLKSDYAKLVLGMAVIGLILVALGVQWWSSHRPIKRENTNLSAKEDEQTKPQQIDQKAKSQSYSGIRRELVAQTLPGKMPQEKAVSVVDAQDQGQTSPSAAKPNPAAQTTLQQTPGIDQNSGTLPGSEKPVQAQSSEPIKLADGSVPPEQAQAATPIPPDEGVRWLMSQPVDNVTLQLMALPDEQAIIEVIARHKAALGENLRYAKTKSKSGRDRFVLLYGSFSDSGLAKQSRAMLPKELQKSWVRKISAIQQEMLPVTPPSLPNKL